MIEDKEFQERLTFYIEAFEKTRKQVGDATAAAAILQETAKDRRVNYKKVVQDPNGPTTEK